MYSGTIRPKHQALWKYPTAAAAVKDFIKKYESHIEENNGFLSIDVLRAQKDPSKMYAKFTKINKQAGQQEVKKVAMAEFMPDREATKEDDLPF